MDDDGSEIRLGRARIYRVVVVWSLCHGLTVTDGEGGHFFLSFNFEVWSKLVSRSKKRKMYSTLWCIMDMQGHAVIGFIFSLASF